MSPGPPRTSQHTTRTHRSWRPAIYTLVAVLLLLPVVLGVLLAARRRDLSYARAGYFVNLVRPCLSGARPSPFLHDDARDHFQTRLVWVPYTMLERAVLSLVDVGTVSADLRARYTYLAFACLAAMLVRHCVHAFRVRRDSEAAGPAR